MPESCSTPQGSRSHDPGWVAFPCARDLLFAVGVAWLVIANLAFYGRLLERYWAELARLSGLPVAGIGG